MITAQIGKDKSVCLFQSGVNVFVCTSILRARLRMQMTAFDFLLGIGFAFVFTSASHSSRHRLRIIMTLQSAVMFLLFQLFDLLWRFCSFSVSVCCGVFAFSAVCL